MKKPTVMDHAKALQRIIGNLGRVGVEGGHVVLYTDNRATLRRARVLARAARWSGPVVKCVREGKRAQQPAQGGAWDPPIGSTPPPGEGAPEPARGTDGGVS